MHPRAELARTLILACAFGCALLMSAAASAQASPPSEAAQALNPTAVAEVTSILQLEESQQRLREQLADSEQRAQLINECLRQQRASNPDLARVLGIDAGTEQELLALLVDHDLADQLRRRLLSVDGGGSGEDLRLQGVENYDQQVREIANVIGTARLDAYLDYVRTRPARGRIQGFAASLPAAQQLTNEQKDSLVELFVADERVRERGLLPGRGESRWLREITARADGRKQTQLLLAIFTNEQLIRQMQAADRALLERLPRFLTAEQTHAYGAHQARQVAELRARTDSTRREVSVDLDEVLEQILDAQDAAPQRTELPNARLQLLLSINGTDLTRVVTSTRGGAVSFEGPDGLWVEAQPSEFAPENMAVELRLYESTQGGRRLVGHSTVQADLTNPRPSRDAVFSFFSSAKNLLRGRKGYWVDWGVRATYL